MTKIYLAKHPKESTKQQHCPTCNRYVKHDERYPNYICNKCKELATDKSNKKLVFYNITNSGQGCQGKYVEFEKLYRSPFCLIKGVKCKAEAMELGGIVIMPVIIKRSITNN